MGKRIRRGASTATKYKMRLAKLGSRNPMGCLSLFCASVTGTRIGDCQTVYPSLGCNKNTIANKTAENTVWHVLLFLF